MKVAFVASVVLAVLVTLVSLAIALTGLHTNPIVSGIGFIVVAIIINLGVVFWALRSTSAENSYGKQFLIAGMIGFDAAILIFLASWVMLTYVFPDYLAEMRVGYLEFMEGAGLPEAQIDEQAAALEATTPANQALAGAIGAFFTSLLGGAIMSIFLRKK